MTVPLAEVLAIARRGWPVFPCHTPTGAGCSCGNPTCKDIGKHPRTKHGRNDATTDEAQIIEWWKRWPDANVAIATGNESALAVLDVDSYAGGDDELAVVEAKHGPAPATVTVLTGGGGKQLYYKMNGTPITSRNGVLAPHLDIKGIGGYVIAPPSLHRSGRRYAWDLAAHPDDVEIAEAPHYLADAGRGASAKEADPSRVTRHARLLRRTWCDRANGLSEVDVLQRALDSTEGRELVAEGREAEVRRMVVGAFAKEPDVFHLTDLGNARRFVHEHAHAVRFSYTSRSWLVWTGTHWQRDADAAVERLAKETVLGFYLEATGCDNEDRRKRLAGHAAKSERSDRISAMLRLAQSEPEVCVTDEVLDPDGWLLNVANGTLNLRTDELRPHDPRDLITHLIPIAYDASAKAPLWMTFLARVLDYDEELHAFIRRAVGYSLTTDTGEQCFFLMHGIGKNGKTTFLETIRAILGPLARNARFDTFLVKRQDTIPSDIARLRGARLVTACEAQDGRRLDEATIKDLTGGDTVTARLRYQDEREFRPTGKIWLSANHRPIIRGQDLAIWRRVKLIPFVVQIPEDERDLDLAAKLRGELAGVLAWAVAGARDWREHRLGTCAAVEAHTTEYKSESDVIGRWLDENCTFDPTEEMLKSELYAAWKKTNEESGESKYAAGNTFAKRLRELHPEVKDRQSGRKRFWVGITLR